VSRYLITVPYNDVRWTEDELPYYKVVEVGEMSNSHLEAGYTLDFLIIFLICVVDRNRPEGRRDGAVSDVNPVHP
jgi:hypothetical protein